MDPTPQLVQLLIEGTARVRVRGGGGGVERSKNVCGSHGGGKGKDRETVG